MIKIKKLTGAIHMTRESHVPSLTLRLFSTIVLGFMLVSVITLYITNYLKDFTLSSILREYRQVQVMYADEITRQLAQAQERSTVWEAPIWWIWAPASKLCKMSGNMRPSDVRTKSAPP